MPHPVTETDRHKNRNITARLYRVYSFGGTVMNIAPLLGGAHDVLSNLVADKGCCCLIDDDLRRQASSFIKGKKETPPQSSLLQLD